MSPDASRPLGEIPTLQELVVELRSSMAQAGADGEPELSMASMALLLGAEWMLVHLSQSVRDGLEGEDLTTGLFVTAAQVQRLALQARALRATLEASPFFALHTLP